MVYGIYQSAAGMQVNLYRQAVLANNLANLDTVGFKRDLTIVRERRVESLENPAEAGRSDRVLDRMTGGSLVSPTFTSFEQGQIQATGGRLDAAIEGDGFFAVDDAGTTRYTRDGRFALNRDGLLVTVAGGRPVLDDQGEPIVVPAQARGRVQIEGGGDVRSGEVSFGRIGTVSFDDRSGLRKVGANLFDAGHMEARPVAARLRTNAIEASTVDPTKAMVSMIEVTRAYELNANLVTLADATLGRAVNDIGRIS